MLLFYYSVSLCLCLSLSVCLSLSLSSDSVLLNSSWSSTNSSEIEQKNKPFSFTQFILEEDLHPNSYPLTPPTLDDFSFTPLLLWQPNPTNYQKTNKQTNNKEERENKILKTMDLTDCLPPEQQSSTKPSAEVCITCVNMLEYLYVTL